MNPAERDPAARDQDALPAGASAQVAAATGRVRGAVAVSAGLALLFSLCAGSAPAQTGPLRGRVYDARQGPAAAREFAIPQAQTELPGGFTVAASLADVTQGRRADVTVTDTTGAEREIVIELGVALADKFTHVLLSDGLGEQAIKDSGRALYRGPLSLPAVTFYGPEAGVTVAAPFEVPAPALTFAWTRT